MKTIEQNTDEFIKYVGIVKQWFKDEELEVSDYVIGRMASRIQTLFKDESKAQLMELVGEDVDYSGCPHPNDGSCYCDSDASAINAYKAELRKSISGK